VTCPPANDPVCISRRGSEEGRVGSKKYPAEQIVAKVSETEALLVEGLPPRARRLVIVGGILLHLAFASYLSAQQLPFHYYSVKDGLASNQVHSLLQDAHGYLWIGTSEGISRFDGVTFTNFTVRDGLAFNYINSILEPRESPGEVWFGTNGNGISVYAQSAFTTLDVGDSPGARNVNTLFQDRAGTIWIGTDDGIFRVEAGHATRLAPEDAMGPVGSIAETADGKILFAFSVSLGEYIPATGGFTEVRLPLKHGIRIDRIWADREKSVWMATSDGAISEVENFLTIERARIGSRFVYDVAQDERGHFLVGTMRGLFEIQKSGTTRYRVLHYTESSGLRDRFTSSLLIDREGNLWIGTLGAGISKLGDRDIALFPMRDPSGLLSQPAAAADTNGHLWAANASGLDELFHSGNGGWSIVHHPEVPDLNPQRIIRISVDRYGKLWVTYVDGELRRFDILPTPGRESRLTHTVIVPPQFTSFITPPASVLVDRKRRLWYCCDPVHAVVLDVDNGMKVLKRFTLADSLPGRHITTVHEDSAGNVWIGGFSDGLVLVSATGGLQAPVRRFKKTDGLPDNDIRALCTATDGRVWVGTRFGGLASFSGGRFTSYGIGQGLLSDAVVSLAADDSGKVWVGTSLGFQSCDPNGQILFGTIIDLDGERIETCGISKGDMVWGTTHLGLFAYETPHRRPVDSAPTAMITRLAVNGLTIPLANDLAFSHDRDNCVIEFLGVSLRHGPSVQYQYRLQGLEKDWSPLTGARTVTYAVLAPGPYKFQVRTVLRGNPSTGAHADLSFTITPPFWRRWWFLLLVAGVALGTPWLFYRYRMRRLFELDQLRIRIASDLHDDIGSTLTKIAIQSEVIQTAESPDRITHASREIGRMSREVVSTLSDMVWSIDARHDVLRDLVDRMRSFSSGFLVSAEIEHSFTVEGVDLGRVIDADLRHNVYLIFKEAINNTVRHARASRVSIDISFVGHNLVLSVQDDGVGFTERQSGHGLKNMKMRAARLGGGLDMTCENGTTLTLRVPLGR
jgi:ligand-binding sensor domain-containing protein